MSNLAAAPARLALLEMTGCGPSGPADAGVPDADAIDSGAADAETQTEAGPQGGCDVSAETNCGYRPARAFTETSETAEFTLATSVAGRELPGIVRFPRGATEPLPVVLFAHAGSWSRRGHNSSQEWSRALARAGYAVLHWSVVMPTEEQLRQICMQVGVTSPDECDDRTVLGGEPPNPFSAIVLARAHDPVAILDNFAAIAAHVEAEAGVALDVSRVALAGWSGGSQPVVQSAGAVRRVTASITYELPDARFDAFVAMSPQYAPEAGFFDEPSGSSWDAVRGPILFLTGDGDEKPANDLTGPLRRMVFELVPAADATLFYATLGADRVGHTSFDLQDLGGGEPELDALARAMVMVVQAHLDAHLRGHAPAVEWLASTDPVRAAAGHAEWTAR